MRRVDSLRVIRLIRSGSTEIETAFALLSGLKFDDDRQEKFDCESRNARFDLTRRERLRFN